MLALPARWTCRPYSVAAAERLSAELRLSPTVAAILVRRGYDSVEQARRFLAADERHDPFLLSDVSAACEAILRHARRGSRVVIHGDYDVDGVCSTALLVRTLRALGAAPAWQLPSRFDDGYGLTSATVERLAADGTSLLITVDCAITATEEVEQLRARGIDVVVTDHHRPGERLPPCPTVHPALGGYPFPDLCATAIAQKLSEALYASAGLDPSPAEKDLDLVALATVCDVVPLQGENRRLVRDGLRALARTEKPGLRALMVVAGVDPGAVDANAVGFRLGPRLNAAGRLQRADAALELLLTEDGERAAEVADELDLLNRERQDAESRMLFAAESARAEQAEAPAYVLAGEGWHQGVIGIVASRMVERHHRPCVMIALEEGGARGSGRSIAAYDLHGGLSACAEHLRRFGGHRMAAGFDIDLDAVEGFRRAFVAHAAATLSPEELTPTEHVDALVPGGALGLELAEELELLAPFGQGNPRPTLLVPAARVDDVRSMGEEGQHARFSLASGGARARGVAFRTSAKALGSGADEHRDVAVRLERNEWHGVVEPQVVLRSACPPEHGRCELLGEEDFWAGVEHELHAADPLAWGVAPGRPVRKVCDRRGEGFAGVAGDLISSGESVLLVCADARRRLTGLKSSLAGLTRASSIPSGGLGALGRVAAASWNTLGRDPGLGAWFDHLVALDPPPAPAGEAVLAAVPLKGDGQEGAAPEATGFAHLAWGIAEARFTLAVASAELDLRTPLVELYRTLRAAGRSPVGALEGMLRGGGRYPRSATVCGRLLRVLRELDLVSYELETPGGPSCRVLQAPRTELERSAAYRAYRQRLGEAQRYLADDATEIQRAA